MPAKKAIKKAVKKAAKTTKIKTDDLPNLTFGEALRAIVKKKPINE